MTEQNTSLSLSPEELERIAEADSRGREEAKTLLGERAAESFFTYMDAKRVETPITE